MNITVTNGAIQLDYADSSKTLYKGSVSQINVRKFNILIVSEEENINVPFAMIETINGTAPADMYEVKTIIDANFNSGGATPQTNYSTDETVIGTWIDGKPIYRKVIPFPDTNYSFNVIHNLSIDTYIVRKIKVENSGLSGGILYIGDLNTNDDSLLGEIIYTSNDISVENLNEYVLANGLFILEYTKTTD